MKNLSVAIAMSALGFFASAALAQEVKGQVTAVEGEGRTVVIDGGTKVAISASGTKIVIKNAPGTRADIVAGMTCTADAAKATTITCD
ncbi:MAG: hypothetical protein Q8M31_10305 [Beijerinckiaceae bacterium]|nr:hypothetical protein [Beijerinckiaceae bacterium]